MVDPSSSGNARDPSPVCGWVAPGFEAVQAEFRRNFSERGEIGAACAAYHRGEVVVDLWGGYSHARRQTPWQEDTLVIVFSATKGLAAMTLALAHSRGWLDHDQRVAAYWPEFGQEGKEQVTVRQLLAHQAGLCGLDESLSLDILADPDALAAVLARQAPCWEPGEYQGYHALSLGWYEGELLRRVDPQHRTLGQFFQEEIALPLGIEFYIGLPLEVPDARLAALKLPNPSGLFRAGDAPLSMFKAMVNPRSLTFRAFAALKATRESLKALKSRSFLALENPAFTGIGQVRAMARAYAAFATADGQSGGELDIHPETLDALTAPPVPPATGTRDRVLHVDVSFSLGFLRPLEHYTFGSSPRAFGAPGAGGSFAFADPDAQVGYAYAPNKMGLDLLLDPRETALREALYRCLGAAPPDGPGV
jgi:CubicO group peptidase (beta-lactamase class C family)